MSDRKQNMAFLRSETDFGLELLRQQDVTKSLVFSPLSISLALSLVHAAAKGETRDQIRNVLVKGATDEQFEQYFANISAALLAAERGTQVNIANHVFTKNGYPIKQTYLEAVKKLYNAGATPLDFRNQQAAADAINNFVKTNTREKINQIIDANDINENLVAVLANALYFKAAWLDQFEARSTFKTKFFTSAEVKREIDFLSDSHAYRRYAENEQFQVLSLPYEDYTFALTIFLPKTRFGLSEGIKSLDSATIQQLLSNVSPTLVDVIIPKWKIESQLSLKETLYMLGIEKAFEIGSADLSNLADRIHISGVEHKALIEVDENGTTAAAVTITLAIEGCGANRGPRPIPIPFTADHPFLFVLSHNNHPLFIGIHR